MVIAAAVAVCAVIVTREEMITRLRYKEDFSSLEFGFFNLNSASLLLLIIMSKYLFPDKFLFLIKLYLQ